MCVCVCVCVYVYICVCIYIYIHTHTHSQLSFTNNYKNRLIFLINQNYCISYSWRTLFKEFFSVRRNSLLLKTQTYGILIICNKYQIKFITHI